MGKAEFDAAVVRVKTRAKAPPPKTLLDLYSLYKQASDGDVTGERPGMLDIRARAKFDAWATRKGMPRETAMEQYVALVDGLFVAQGKG